MSDSGEVRRRLDAAALVLGNLEGAAGHEAASRLQKHALIATTNRSTIASDDRAELSCIVAAMKWHGSDRDDVLQALLVEPCCTPSRSRRTLQQYFAVTEYLTRSEWDSLIAEKNTATTKIDIIVNRCIRLGLRRPTEHTLKLLTSLWLAVSEAPERLAAMPTSQKVDSARYFKACFKAAARRAAEPGLHLERLPATPAELQAKHASTYGNAYEPGEAPIPCPIDLAPMRSVDVSFRCRGCVGTSSGALQLSVASAGPRLEQFASGVMQSMEGMYKMQAITLGK